MTSVTSVDSAERGFGLIEGAIARISVVTVLIDFGVRRWDFQTISQSKMSVTRFGVHVPGQLGAFHKISNVEVVTGADKLLGIDRQE